MNSIASSPSSQRNLSLHDLLHVDDDFLTVPVTPTLGLRRIMVPSDFSPVSARAIHYARHFALQFGAELLIAHVRDPLQSVPGYYPLDEVQRAHESVVRDSIARLSRIAEADCPREDFARLTFRYLVTEGEPVSEIVRMARENDVDLMIISTHGYAGHQNLLVGGVADKIVHLAPCPVLIVKEMEHDFVSSNQMPGGIYGPGRKP